MLTGYRGGRSHLSNWRLALVRRSSSLPPGDGRATHCGDSGGRVYPLAGIHGLATHKTCGMPCRHDTRWALTPPFHHHLLISGTRGLSFSVTLLCRHRQLPVKEYGALCCPDFPLAAQCRTGTLGKRHDRPATIYKSTNIISIHRKNFPTFVTQYT